MRAAPGTALAPESTTLGLLAPGLVPGKPRNERLGYRLGPGGWGDSYT